MLIQKVIARGDSWLKALKTGVEVVEDLVGSTIGPSGRNVIIYRKYKSPLITNDGVTVARHIYLDDEMEDLAAQTLVEISLKTNEQAGDGTTTSVVIAANIVKAALERIGDGNVIDAGADPMTLFREINEAKPKVIARLHELAQKVDSEKLVDIVTTSLENREFAVKIAEMIETVGPDGYISVDDNYETKYGIETETITGMKFYGTYVTPYMINKPQRREAVWENADVLVTNEHIDNMSILNGFIKEYKTSGKRNLVIIAEKFETNVIQQLAAAIQQAKSGDKDMIKVLAIKAPTCLTEELQDIATYCNATFFDKKTGATARKATMTSLGFIPRIVVDQDDVIMTGGEGDVSVRLEAARGQLEVEKDPMFKAKLKRRIAGLAAGIGVIRVGAMTEQERTYWKHKIEDAVHAAKAAVEEGYVAGGGVALATIAQELGEDHILHDALFAPGRRIRDNAGGVLVIPDTVIDPVKVTRMAFENACSAAGILITTGSGITEKRKTILDALEQQISPEEDDFRDYSEHRQPGRVG